MSEFQWPESVPWLTADDVVPACECDGHWCPYCYVTRVFNTGEQRTLATLALASCGIATTPQAAADAWNRAMAELGYCEVYEV
jgi:hypothetical protein